MADGVGTVLSEALPAVLLPALPLVPALPLPPAEPPLFSPFSPSPPSGTGVVPVASSLKRVPESLK